jgi:hypothetical protein
MSTSIKNGKIVKSKYAEIREAARKGAEFNEVIPYDEELPYISDERIDSLLTRLAREDYSLPGFTEGLLILVYAIAPAEIRDDDDKLLELASFYVNVETARNDTIGLLEKENRNLALYF